MRIKPKHEWTVGDRVKHVQGRPFFGRILAFAQGDMVHVEVEDEGGKKLWVHSDYLVNETGDRG